MLTSVVASASTPAPTAEPTAEPTPSPTEDPSCIWWYNENRVVDPSLTGACVEGPDRDIWSGTTRYCSYEACCADNFPSGQCSYVEPTGGPTPEPTISPRPTDAPTPSPTSTTPAPTTRTAAPTTCKSYFNKWYFNGERCTNDDRSRSPSWDSADECCKKSGEFEQGACAWCDYCLGGDCKTPEPTKAPTPEPTPKPTPVPTAEPTKAPTRSPTDQP